MLLVFQRQPEVERVLTSMLPFLTAGREAAYQAEGLNTKIMGIKRKADDWGFG